MTSSLTINTINLLSLIHKAEAELKVNPDPDLRRLTETSISILAFYMRKPYVVVTYLQAEAIDKLKNLLGEK
jgi:hypothetical protein